MISYFTWIRSDLLAVPYCMNLSQNGVRKDCTGYQNTSGVIHMVECSAVSELSYIIHIQINFTVFICGTVL